jgi:hypothetical protein
MDGAESAELLNGNKTEGGRRSVDGVRHTASTARVSLPRKEYANAQEQAPAGPQGGG